MEIYAPRQLSDYGNRAFEALTVKVYGLCAQGKAVTDVMLADAMRFVKGDVLQSVTQMGESNGLGFVIVHPGDLGVSVSAHWWVQGSVLCQKIHRQLYDADTPMDTAARPVVACVWELAIINAEQVAWRRTMMQEAPDPASYLSTRPSFDAA